MDKIKQGPKIIKSLQELTDFMNFRAAIFLFMLADNGHSCCNSTYCCLLCVAQNVVTVTATMAKSIKHKILFITTVTSLPVYIWATA